MWWSCHCLHISMTGGWGMKSSGGHGVWISLLAGTGTGVIILSGRDVITTPLGFTEGRLSAEFMAKESSSPLVLFLYLILCNSSCRVMIGRFTSFLCKNVWQTNTLLGINFAIMRGYALLGNEYTTQQLFVRPCNAYNSVHHLPRAFRYIVLWYTTHVCWE